MSWGCRPERHPDGCGWSARLTYPSDGTTEWWCDGCERAGVVYAPAAPAAPAARLPTWLPEPAELEDLADYAHPDCPACHGTGVVDAGPCGPCIVDVWG